MQLLLNEILSFFSFLLIGFSFSLIYHSTRFFHIAHAIIITSGAYFVFFFTNKFSIPFPVSVTLSILATAIIGVACEILVYRQMRKRNVPALAYLIASIGLYVVLQNCISLFFGDDTKIINTAEVTVGHQVFDAYITTIQIITIVVSIALFVAVNLFLHYTATGKSIRAVASNPELCNIYGISSNKIILIAFGIGSALAATAGILSAMDTNMTPTFGFNLLLYGVVAMIIGGVGSTRGLVAGALLIASAQHLAAYYIDTKWMDAVTYIILILFLIWKPLGFSGKRLKKVEV
ncbi:MAG: High-affinity branched-chain amino acid transport system permease protein LivH [Bacteroidia bacterium]|nr:High-affinity branched-chain amino acid transport system permease protein LivH [Bacteroidia bacterium]